MVGDPDQVDQVQLADPEKVVWISQTTLSVDETKETVGRLRQRFPQLVDPPSDDICFATQNRQGAVKEIGQRCDVMIVVGSANSSNSVRLKEVALDAGAKAAYRIDKAEEIQPQWIEKAQVVGLTSGASVPEILVKSVIEHLADYGFDQVEQIQTASEKVTFALPAALRNDLKQAGLLEQKDKRRTPGPNHTC